MFSRLRSNIVVLWIVRLLALPVIVLLYVAGFVLNLLYGICGSIGMVLAGLGGFAAFLALLDGSYAQAAASALVALLLCRSMASRISSAESWEAHARTLLPCNIRLKKIRNGLPTFKSV